MEEVQERGLASVMDDALNTVTRGTRGFGLTIDLDGFDPADVPGVGLKVLGGLRGTETSTVLRGIGGDPRLQALEIVEYSPDLDRQHQTARLVLDLLSSILAPAAARAALVPSAA
jgi:arginase